MSRICHDSLLMQSIAFFIPANNNFGISIQLVQNSTSVLYFLYMAYVLKVQSLCTNATKPMYKQYRGFVQKLYKYNRIVFHSL